MNVIKLKKKIQSKNRMKITKTQLKQLIKEEIEEMKLLANTIGYNIADSIQQNRLKIDLNSSNFVILWGYYKLCLYFSTL